MPRIALGLGGGLGCRLGGGRFGGGLGGGGSGLGRSGDTNDGGGLDGVEARPLGGKIFFATLADGVLIHAGGVAVLVVKHFDEFHAIAINHPEGGEALGIERGVVFEIDEKLRGAGVGSGGGEDDGAALVALRVRIVLDGGLVPCGGSRRTSADTELRDEIGKDAEETSIIEVVVLDEIVEAIGAERRPGARDGDGEFAAGSIEFDLVGIGSFVFEESGFQESVIVSAGSAGRFGGGGGFGLRRSLRGGWGLRECGERKCRGQRGRKDALHELHDEIASVVYGNRDADTGLAKSIFARLKRIHHREGGRTGGGDECCKAVWRTYSALLLLG